MDSILSGLRITSHHYIYGIVIFFFVIPFRVSAVLFALCWQRRYQVPSLCHIGNDQVQRGPQCAPSLATLTCTLCQDPLHKPGTSSLHCVWKCRWQQTRLDWCFSFLSRTNTESTLQHTAVCHRWGATRNPSIFHLAKTIIGWERMFDECNCMHDVQSVVSVRLQTGRAAPVARAPWLLRTNHRLSSRMLSIIIIVTDVFFKIDTVFCQSPERPSSEHPSPPSLWRAVRCATTASSGTCWSFGEACKRTWASARGVLYEAAGRLGGTRDVSSASTGAWRWPRRTSGCGRWRTST